MGKNAIYTVVAFSFCTFLFGCAGSATHKVVSAHDANDDALSCKQIDAEMVRAQVIIDGVNADKADLNGADWVDGILWFPFNLIAKNSNYKDALEAADKRIERLSGLKKEKNCQATSTEVAQYSASLATEMDKLNALYKDDSISAQEYQLAKAKLLGMPTSQFESEKAENTANTSAHTTLSQGSSGYAAEELAKTSGCETANGARPIAVPLQINGALEVYEIECVSQHMTVRCENNGCKVTM